MTIEGGEWVVYHPPKSVSFGHQSRVRDPRRSWPMVERFLAELTTFTLGSRVVLTCHDPGPQTDTAAAAARLAEARRCFGPERASGMYRTHPHWTLSESQVTAAVRFALDDDSYPEQPVGPSRLSFNYQFCWNEFDRFSGVKSGTESRSLMSSLGVIIGRRRLFLQPDFIYPAPWNSEPLKDFIDRTESIVPFRFRDQYFKRWLPPLGPRSKFGRQLRLDANWRRGTSLH
jgi:hypothetical protein